jgi:hypothetical protein
VQANDQQGPLTVAAAASIILPQDDSDLYYISGTIPITTILNGLWIKRTIRLIFSDPSPGGVGAGGNIGRAQTAAQGQVITLTTPDGITWYLTRTAQRKTA